MCQPSFAKDSCSLEEILLVSSSLTEIPPLGSSPNLFLQCNVTKNGMGKIYVLSPWLSTRMYPIHFLTLKYLYKFLKGLWVKDLKEHWIQE